MKIIANFLAGKEFLSLIVSVGFAWIALSIFPTVCIWVSKTIIIKIFNEVIIPGLWAQQMDTKLIGFILGNILTVCIIARLFSQSSLSSGQEGVTAGGGTY